MSTIKNKTGFQINQSAGELFPLFSPEGEKLWIPGFDYENIMGSTEMHEDYIFFTHGHPYDIWLVKRYEPSSYFIQFYWVEPFNVVSIVTVQCKPISAAMTEVEVSYDHVGLSEEGEDLINGRTKERFEAFMGNWKIWLEGYFEAKAE
jgi:hypothetical protein